MRQRTLVVCLLLTALTTWVYLPVRHFGFVSFDDPGYVTEKAIVQQGLTPEGIVWAFTTLDRGNWHPLTWLSYMVECELFGVNAGAHHLVNGLLHLLSTLLLFGFLRSQTGETWPSAAVAALFAIHPLHVESVAWISERKDVLSGFFWFASLWSYASYARRGGIARYALTFALVAAGLMAKPMLVTLPFVFLLLDFWPLGRTPWVSPAIPSGDARIGAGWWRGLLIEKVPFLVLVAASAAVTLRAQGNVGAVVDLPMLDPATRLANAVVAYVWYLAKAIWPSGLAVLYPHPGLFGGSGWGATAVAGAALLLAGVTVAALYEWRRRPYLLVGWLWFLGTLVPVIGIVQVGQQAVADRYSYLPLTGPFIAVAWGAAELVRRQPWMRAAIGAVAMTAIAGYAVAARAQLGHWRDSRSLAMRAVEVTEGNYVMHYNLALALAEEGEIDASIEQHREAIQSGPPLALLHNSLAAALAYRGEVAEAIVEYSRAIELDPEDPAAMTNLAWLLATHPDERFRDADQALVLAEAAVSSSAASDANALDALAAAQASASRFDQAERTAREAARLAREAEREDLARAIEERRAGYRRGKAYLALPEAPVTASPHGG